MIRILVVDDHPVVRDGLVAMLSTQPDFAVVAEAAGGREAITRFAALRPDVVLLDLEMPDLDGVEALHQMVTHDPSPHVLVFTAFDTDERILNALKAGAQGYQLKGAPRDELFRAIRIIHQGGSLLQPVVASRLLGHMRAQASPKPELTPREMDVLHLIARGLRNQEIASQLSISERTVKFHVSEILSRLGASNRTEAVRLAAQQGLIQIA